MFRSVFGAGLPAAPPKPRCPVGTITFAAIFDKRMVGSITLQRPGSPVDGASGWRAEAATVLGLEAEVAHQESGCREALLDVAQQWARANDFQSLEAVVPATANAADFYLLNGFQIVGMAHEPAPASPSIVLALRLADAQPHTDAWYSKHHGAWFASVVQH